MSHSESGRTKNDRRGHDKAAKSHATTNSSNPYHLSKNMQAAMAVIAVILVIGVTSLFLTGIIRL